MALTQVQGSMLSGSSNTTTTIQSNGTTAITIDSSQNSTFAGNVLGTASTFQIGVNTTGKDARLGVLSGGNGRVEFYTGGSEIMRLTSDGAIGFGTTTWGGANGISMSNASDSASYGKSMLFNSPYNGTRNAINFQYNSGQVGTIVTGTSSTSYNSGSDYRLKDNPQPLTGSGAFIDALQPKTWTWKIDGKPGVGFIAHEVQEISPDSVFGEKDAVDENGKPIIQTMEYGSSEFIANMIAELQDLRKRVAALEAK